MIDPRDEWQLVGGGDTLLHFHLADRATNAGLQSDSRRREIIASGAVRPDDDYLLVDTSGVAVTLSLPVSRNGKEFEFTLIDATHSLTVTPESGDTINGQPDMILTLQYTSIRLKAVPEGWVAI